ncbi:hypothetical protein GCK32_010545 [Trichostrongylus colubriformis]|uniref:Uncharacterized protein n=1 Tax=Trichostrongylus colubriformis TaxID=6319 RepID=A0AAN8G8A3_TRICO
MGGLTSRAVNEPKTIAEAKAEITELLTKIKDHYEAINRMRLADRNKWKDFNKTVEELEVVKARALKEEKKRQRDLEREQERRLLEESGGPQQLSAQPSTETKKSTKTEEAVVIVTSQFPYNMPLEDLDKTQATVAEDSAVEPRKCSYGSDTGLHRAKVVTLPIASDNSDIKSTKRFQSVTIPYAASKDKRSKSASKTKELLQSVDMSDIKQRYY